MKHYEIKDNCATIFYTFEEPTSRHDPFYLQNIMYDLPFDIGTLDALTLKLSIPKNMSVYIIDDLHFVSTKTNNIVLELAQKSQVIYRLFVANHQLCDTCPKKEADSCQTIPPIFEKTLTVSLLQPNAQAYVNCHYLGDQSSQCNITTIQHHLATHTTSKLAVKGVLDDSAKLISDNTIIVEKNIEHVVAEQINKNLLLCNKARVISLPKLKIQSQNVSCKHGATVTTLDKNELFYLQSRGVGIGDSKRLLIGAFLHI